jgi:hypothetical protein
VIESQIETEDEREQERLKNTVNYKSERDEKDVHER